MHLRSVGLLAMVVLAFPGAAGADEKVTLCHVPPGNPANAHTITVGEAAVRAHVAHGDQLGACPIGCSSSCGDGVVQSGEQCDDGNTNPFDGCDDCILVDTTPD
jgi:cysteine-rich repeat protein